MPKTACLPAWTATSFGGVGCDFRWALSFDLAAMIRQAHYVRSFVALSCCFCVACVVAPTTTGQVSVGATHSHLAWGLITRPGQLWPLFLVHLGWNDESGWPRLDTQQVSIITDELGLQILARLCGRRDLT